MSKNRSKIGRALHDREFVEEVTVSDCLAEMLGAVQLMYNDTIRVLRGINAEIELYNGMIDRAVTQEEKDELSLRQAIASQKPAVQGKIMDAILNTVNKMYDMSKNEKEIKDNRLVFVNDFEVHPSDDSNPIAICDATVDQSASTEKRIIAEIERDSDDEDDD